MKHATYIDNITLQVTVDTKEEQREKLDKILSFIEEEKTNLKVIYPDYTKGDRDIKIRNKRNTIAKISTSAFSTGKRDAEGKFILKWYVSIRFKGLQRYIKRLDNLSIDLLLCIASFMNDNTIKFKISELHIAIDAETKFRNMLVICTNPFSRVNYNILTDTQVYNTTRHVEVLSPKGLRRRSIQSYFYCKSTKEALAFDISRYEIALTSKFINQAGLLMDRIENTLDRYHIMVFNDIEIKNKIIKEHSIKNGFNDADIRRLNLSKYRITADIDYIDTFIKNLFTINKVLLDIDGSYI